MADNIEFRSDMADKGHIGEAVGLYEAKSPFFVIPNQIMCPP